MPQKPLKDYVSVYGVSYSTIKTWNAKGYPLDDEDGTRARIAAQRTSPQISLGVPPDNPALLLTSARNLAPEALGLAASILRLRQAEAEAHGEYQNASATDKGWRLKQWLELGEQLRKVEKDNPDIEAANNQAVKIADVSLELAGLFRNLRNDLDNLGKRVASECVGKDAIEIKQLIDEQTAGIVADLYAAKYLTGGGSE